MDCHTFLLSPIQTLTVGARITLAPPLSSKTTKAGHGLKAIALTAGREFHPAPKEYFAHKTKPL